MCDNGEGWQTYPIVYTMHSYCLLSANLTDKASVAGHVATQWLVSVP